MLITKEQQEALIENYIKQGHSTDQCDGFISGVEKTMALIGRLAAPVDNRISQLESQNKKLLFMVENGLGKKDMENDCI